ncbi:MAG: sulfurtransferase TusA family protein [Proteobacteria bacterium]|nr:MAG: sulfurtransferase TusA family protein [Pseudomonadota bacterium]
MHILDLSGMMCPIPVLKTKKFLAPLISGEKVTIITTDPDSLQDLKDFCHKTGNYLESQTRSSDKIITIIVRR